LKKISCFLTIAVLAVLLVSCGDDNIFVGKVSLFVTDDISGYQQVAAVINSVSVISTGTLAACGLLTEPSGVDVAELSDEILLLDVSPCIAGHYNRIQVVFNERVTLTDGSATQTCRFVSYKDDSGNPNVLVCDPGGDICALEINGAVNVFGDKNEKLALDFALKDFEVAGFPGQDCTVTMKVSPLHAAGIDGKTELGYMESVVGSITSHDAGSMAFKLRHGNVTYTVDYSGVSQQNIGELLDLTLAEDLKVKVLALSIGSGGKITATGVLVKVKGVVSGLDSDNETFILQFNGTEPIAVDYSTAEVQGLLADGATTDVKLSGVDGTTYIASKVEVDEESVLN
jgi:hypothetical protein